MCCTKCRKTFSRRNNEPTDVLNDSCLILVVYLLAGRFKDIVAEECIAGNWRCLLQERPTKSLAGAGQYMTADSNGFKNVGVGERGARISRRECLEKLSVVLRSLGSDKIPVWCEDNETAKASCVVSLDDVCLKVMKAIGPETGFATTPFGKVYCGLGTSSFQRPSSSFSINLLTSWASPRRNHGDISEGFGTIVEIVPVTSACLQLERGG